MIPKPTFKGITRVYISGKITGTDDYMRRFAKAERKLKRKGYVVINPAKVNANFPASFTWEDYMDFSLLMLKKCDCIYMLKGWEGSKGAKRELIEAKYYKKQAYYEFDK